jgi:hypothetical protein
MDSSRHATHPVLAWNRHVMTRIQKLVYSTSAALRSVPSTFPRAQYAATVRPRGTSPKTVVPGRSRRFMLDPGRAQLLLASPQSSLDPPAARRTPATRAAHTMTSPAAAAPAHEPSSSSSPSADQAQQVKYAGAPPPAFLPTKNSSRGQLRHPRIVPHHGVARMLRLCRPRAGPGGPNPRGMPLPLPFLPSPAISLPADFPLSLRLLIARADRCFACRWGTGHSRVQQGSQPD